MLKLRDCVTGGLIEVKGPEILESGRYALIEKASLGIHGKWPAGTLLVDDSRGFIEVDGIRIEVERNKLDSETEANRDVDLLALEEVLALADFSEPNSLPSPVIPPEIGDRFEFSELESQLTEVIKFGHLQSIAKSPRISMRYDEELLPVSRVKRTASNYQRHLAAHSDCWQQRTFVGVIPKKLKAKISEDEVHIYENRVFARLLEHLERYILTAIARLKVLNQALEDGLHLKDSQSLHRSLRLAMCETWGESYSQDKAEELKSQSQFHLEQFAKQLRTIQQLKQSATYNAIPRDAEVPLSLKNTNILANDPHYLKVRKLWELWVKEVASNAIDPVQIFEQKQRQENDYRQYVALLIIRAHMKLGWQPELVSDNYWNLKHLSNIEGTLSKDEGQWILSYSSVGFDIKYRFMPLTEVWTNVESNDNRVLCSLISDSGNNSGLNCSPRTVNSEESMIQVIQHWWLKVVAPHYGLEIEELPTVVCDQWPENQPKKQFKNPHDLDKFELPQWLMKFSLKPKVAKSIEKAFSAASFIGYCPCCGMKLQPSKFISRDSRAFKAQCHLCAADWQVRSTGNEWVFEIGMESSDQIESGRWKKLISLGTH